MIFSDVFERLIADSPVTVMTRVYGVHKSTISRIKHSVRRKAC